MGQLKQLLPFRGATLLENAIQQACEALFSPIVVVVGAESGRVRDVLSATAVSIAENPDWEKGMGSSIVCGLRTLMNLRPEVSAVAITLGDQPMVTAEHLRSVSQQLITSGADVVAASFEGTLGSPAIFRAATFSALLRLNPESGAKRLFTHPGWRIEPFLLPEAAADVDTPEDFERLVNRPRG